MIECRSSQDGGMRVYCSGGDTQLIAEATAAVEAVISITAHGDPDLWRTRRDQMIALIVTQAARDGLRREA